MSAIQSSTLSGFQLSTQQRHLWSLSSQQLVHQLLLSLDGPLDSDKLHQALQTVVERHDSLRTIFRQPETLTVPLQMVEPQNAVGWQVANWEGQDLEQTVANTCQQERSQDFGQLPVLRAVLGQQATQNWLLLTVPKLCADRKSLHLLVEELAKVYGDQTSALTTDIVQYSEYEAWQRSLPEDEDAAIAQAFWQQPSSPVAAPFQKRHQTAAFQTAVLNIPLAEEVQEQLSSIKDPGALFLAAWLIVLWKHSEQTHFILGVAPQHRSDLELESGIGAYQQLLPLPGNLSESMSCHTLVQQVQQNWQQLEEWQDYFASDGLGSVGYTYQAFHPPVGGDVTFKIEREWGQQGVLPLGLSCLWQDKAVQAEIHYDASLFSETAMVSDRPADRGGASLTAIATLGQHWQTVVSHVLSDPDQLLGNLTLQGETPLPTPTTASYRCFHQQFTHQAQLTPDKIAVVCKAKQLTYRDLDQRANQLAHALQKMGAGPDIPIALYLDRSVDAMVAILAILKAGSAYLPLDPALPTAGIAYRLQDAQVPLVITEIDLIERLPENSPDTIYVEEGEQAGYPTIEPISTVKPEHLAYLIYTSGSTGKPKPVAVEHRQLMTYVEGIIERLALPAGGSYASVSTLAADLGHTMLFPSLCQGGTLHLMTTEQVCDRKAFTDYCQQHPIDCLKIVPSQLQALLKGANPGDVLPHQRLILGGEVCRWSLVETLMELNASSDLKIFNHYGPTETTVGVLTYPVTSDAYQEAISATVPMGIPIDGVQVYLLDAQLQPVATGIPGEVYIGGHTVSRGYLNRPKLNAERFINYSHQPCVSPLGPHATCFKSGNPPNAVAPLLGGDHVHADMSDQDLVPVSEHKSVRLYKTGDRARRLPDGALEFLGRVDQQVKLHGFRIELGEIETILAQHDGIKEGVAMVREDQPDNPILVAYVVTTTEGPVDSVQLRQHLQTQLPDYMIPSLFVGLKALPLTSNGKVNRLALPIPEKVRPELSQNFVAPRTDTEVAIATIWCEVLQLGTVGVTDNFFDLGGHSLLATRVLSRLREAFQIELPLRRLFDARTIEDTAAVIEEILIAEIEALSDKEAEEQLNVH